MTTQDYTATIQVDQSSKAVFDAINNVSGWWTDNVEGSSQKLNDEFTVSFFDGVHVSTQKIIEVIPNKKVVWLVTKSKLNFTKDPQEWTNTKVIFEISEQGNKTQLRLTHQGLVQNLECFGACSNAWSEYMHSLQLLITTGKGQPTLKETKTTKMEKQDFTKSIMVNATQQKAFDAITNFRGWWSEEIEGNTDKLNEVFFYHYKDIHLCKIKLIEMVPGKKLVYQVIDNQFNFTKDKTEWIGTKLVFEITSEDGKTKVKFTHEGLVPEYECYEICNDAWTNYITKSLYDLINTGKGEPNPKEGEGFNAQIVEKWKLK